MKISEILSGWFKKNARSLPWRESKDPYRVWLSEIILQQTRVNQGWEYYTRFTERYPALSDLASAPEDEVLKLWQGLGYYSRARNLLAAAKQVVQDHGGVMPGHYKTLLTLKGVGRYTAAAIASIVWGEPVAAVDGNVARVIARLYGIDSPVNAAAGRREVEQLAEELLDREDPGRHNEAMMEFGALQCVPVKPDCHACPLNSRCTAFRENRVDQLPVKEKKRRVRHRYFYYLVLENGGYLYLRQRGNGDIWRSLYEFPLAESERRLTREALIPFCLDRLGVHAEQGVIRGVSRDWGHVLSHQRLHAVFVHAEVVSRGDYFTQRRGFFTQSRGDAGYLQDDGARRGGARRDAEDGARRGAETHVNTRSFRDAEDGARRDAEDGARRGAETQGNNSFTPPSEWIRVSRDEIEKYAVPRLIERYLEESEQS